MDNIIILLNYTVNFGQPSFEAMANVVKKVHEILEEKNVWIQYNTIQYNKLYLKSENIKHYNTRSNEHLNPT
jgi:small-conductance mechanosensitive channel